MMGDSWACGEWGVDSAGRYELLHPGTQRYLEKSGHEVTLLAQGGHTNWSQLHIFQRRTARQDVVLWFVADPLRDLETFDHPPCRSVREQATQHQRLLEGCCRGLAEAWSGPVWLVGATEPVTEAMCEGRPGWQVICADWLRRLVPGTRAQGRYIHRGWKYGDCDLELLAQHEQGEERAEEFRRRARHERDSDEHRWFWPDGIHPNREAHRLLTEQLILPLT
jgi:hypothetical protein